MQTRGSLLAGVGVGAGLTYVLDPDRGARRRARARDAIVHAAALTSHAMGRTGRDARHRLTGAVASVRSRMRRQEVDDLVLVERVRATLGHVVSHPHAIQVLSSGGFVVLRGPILAREAAPLLGAVRRVRGVRDVIDQLERHDQAEGVPSLQGGRAPAGNRPDVLQYHWSPATRAAVAATGAALVVAGATRRGLWGTVLGVTGAGLIARAATNVPTNRLIGVGSRRRAVDVQKTIVINAPVGEVYAFWSSYENFPRFLSRVLEVRSSERVPRQSHWIVAGPAGARVQFDAELTRVIPNQVIAWRTLPGSPVAHAGIIRFDREADGGTRVHIRMSYNPPAGWFGHGVAAAFGVDPKHSMDADLVRMKTLIETGHAAHDAARRTT